MSITSAEIALITAEIKTVAGRSIVQRVFELDRTTRVLQLRQPGSTDLLLLSTQPQMTRVHFIRARAEQPPSPTAFTMQLRRWLNGALFEQVTQIGADRILRLDFRAVDPQWEPPPEEATPDAPTRAPRLSVALVVELTGRHPNWYLLDKRDVILGQLEAESLGERGLRPGQPWRAPEPAPGAARGETVRYGLDTLPVDDFSRSAALQAHYDAQLEALKFQTLAKSLRTRLQQRLKYLARRVSNIEGDLGRADHSEEYRRRGELLQSAWGRAPRGSTSVRVQDFYDPAMAEVDIPLDPTLNLQENIDHYFREYQRMSRARGQIETRLLESMEAHDAAQAALQSLAQLEALGAEASSGAHTILVQLAADLEARRVLRPQRPQQARAGTARSERKPYREFQSYHGAAILVGRTAADNDRLTTGIARGRDLWFHARDWAGSHVILRMNHADDSPRREDLLDAATLAAWYSRGKNDTLVDVSYTRAKYVRKPKGFAPGQVTIAEASTIALRIEKDRLARLLDQEP